MVKQKGNNKTTVKHIVWFEIDKWRAKLIMNLQRHWFNIEMEIRNAEIKKNTYGNS